MHLSPELADFSQRVTIEHLDVTDDIAEAEDQTAGDDGWQQGNEDLGQMRDASLQRIHVLTCRGLDLILADIVETDLIGQHAIELIDFGAYDHLELPGVGETPLDRGERLQRLDIGDFWALQHETQPGQTVTHGCYVLFAADQLNESANILELDFAHKGPAILRYWDRSHLVWVGFCFSSMGSFPFYGAVHKNDVLIIQLMRAVMVAGAIWATAGAACSI